MIRTDHFKLALLILILGTALLGCVENIPTPDDGDNTVDEKISRFSSGEDLVKAFEEARDQGNNGMFKALGGARMMADMAVAESAAAPQAAGDSLQYSETNVQIQGVDEADIIKTDGNYIYMIAQGNLIIAKSYPEDEADILSETVIENFRPQEMFIKDDMVMIFGMSFEEIKGPDEDDIGKPVDDVKKSDEKAADEEVAVRSMIAPPYYRTSMMTVKLFDVSDREGPELLRTVEFEGSYLTSRLIGDYAYFVVNSYPRWGPTPVCGEIVPLYRDTKAGEEKEEAEPIAECTDIGYVRPIQAQNFITLASMSIADEDEEIKKEVIVGSGQNVYASMGSLYIAQTSWPRYTIMDGAQDDSQKTYVSKFLLSDGNIEFDARGVVKGHILNQFSMDEHKDHFRIATTIRGYSDNKDTSTNNMYILDDEMELKGSVEDIAPGESIYAVRFMGDRGYMVTFKHVDPLFVLDLSDPNNPKILGKLKIPGYSDYLHPFDETHLIGIGKEVDASIDADKIHTEGAVYYTAIQGVKLAIFDVSDVENPIEMHKEVIGDRGTESEATHEHKAFLFDKERGLLVIPMTVAELKEGQDKSDQGHYTFQGAYVYDISLEDGFDLRGRVTHYDDDSAFKKSGYYFRGDHTIRRSLFIEDTLYTFSNTRLQSNDLGTLERIKTLDFTESENSEGEIFY